MWIILILNLICVCNIEGSVLYKTVSGVEILGNAIPDTTAINFESVRYTQPIGPHNRFERAKAIPFSQITDDATKPQNICPQFPFAYSFNFTQNEDCLYLSLTIPHRQHNNHRLYPVIVFMHGGGHMAGSSLDSYISAIPFTKENIIFVSINYRLGYLGTMLHSQASIINLAQYDQMEALRCFPHWIKANIHQFHGDASKVTAMGQSAGANSIMMLLLSKTVKTENLFQRAIIMSGDIANFAPKISENDMEYYQNEIYDKRFGCSDMNDVEQWECLKRLNIKTITYFGYFRLPPTWFLMRNAKIKPMFAAGNNDHEIDFNRHPMDVLRSGDFHKIPIIIGTTSNEGALFYKFVFLGLLDANEQYVKNMLNAAFPHVDNMNVEQVYDIIANETAQGTAKEIMMEIIGMHGIYSNYLFMKWWSEYGVDVYNYVWNISNDPIDGNYFAWHGDELPHIFETYLDFHGKPLRIKHTNMTKKVTQQFAQYLVSFANTGTPNPGNGAEHSGAINWQTFDNEGGGYLVVDKDRIYIKMNLWKSALLNLYEKLFESGWLSKGDAMDISEFEPCCIWIHWITCHKLLRDRN